MLSESLIVPDWPAPSRVKSLQTTRQGGFSTGPYASLNLGAHVGDVPLVVARNRMVLSARLPSEPVWLNQVHGVAVSDAGQAACLPQADACISNRPGAVCVVMTADCLPVLLCDAAGTVVGAVHAGWRSLCEGVIEHTVERMGARPESLMAWLGRPSGLTHLKLAKRCGRRLLPASRRPRLLLWLGCQGSGLPTSGSLPGCVFRLKVFDRFMAGKYVPMPTRSGFIRIAVTASLGAWEHSSGWSDRHREATFSRINGGFCDK